jgi:hypothetical protein
MDDINEKQPPDVLTSDTENRTIIPVDEAPPHRREKFRKFRAYNTEMWNGPRRENTEQMRRQDNLHTYDAVAAQMDLTDYQKARGRNVLDDLHVKSLGKPIEHVIFGVCLAVANADVEDGTRYWPHPASAANDETFTRVADSLDITRKEQLSVVQQVKAKTDL